jgi:hypothetical protein
MLSPLGLRYAPARCHVSAATSNLAEDGQVVEPGFLSVGGSNL